MDPRMLKPQPIDFMGPPEPMDLPPQNVAPIAPPVAEAPKPEPFDFSKLMVTPEELQQRAEQKRQNAMMGGIGQALSNRSSFGHAFLGLQPVKQDMSATVKAMDEAADAPIEAKQALLKQEIQKPELEYMKSRLSMDSDQTKIAQAGAMARLQYYKGFANPQMGRVIEEMSKKVPSLNAYDLEKSMSGFDKAFEPIMTVQAKREQAKMMASLAGARLDRTDTRIGMDANDKYSKELGSAEKQIYNANRILSLTEKIKSALSNPNDPDAVKATQQLRADLSGALASMVNGGKPATVYGMSHQDFDSLYGRAQTLMSKLTGDPQGTMTPEQIQQLENDVKAMREEYGLSHEIAFNAFQEGLPNAVRGPLEKRFKKFRSEALSQGGGEKLAPSGVGIPGVSDANASVATTPGAGMKTQPAGLSDKDLEAIKAIQEQMKLPKEQRDPNFERALMKVTKKLNGGQ